jgi:hypothetical protein
VSAALSIDLKHHHAGSDSHACAEILLSCMAGGADTKQFIQSFAFD